MEKRRLLVKGVSPPPLDRELTIIGKPLSRIEGVEKVTGRARYSGDIRLPGMLYAKILHCPHPRARITKLDTRRAEDLPGVKSVLTKDNTKGWRTYWYKVPQMAFPEVLTYEGQEVAVVAAEEPAIAQKALDLIEVEYEVLTPMLDAEETLNRPPPPCEADEEYPGREIFDRKKYVISRGDLQKGLDQAEVVIEDVYTLRPQYHGTIQTRACVAHWDGHGLTVWDASQGVWNSKEVLAKSLDLDPEKIRVLVKYLGGGFGSKAWCQRISFYAAKLSLLTGRPVRLEQTRGEEFLMHPHRWDCRIFLKMGAKKDGALTAIYQRAVVNIGAAALADNYFPVGIIWHTSNLYACPNVHLEQIGVYTNLQLTGPTRAPFNMPAIFSLESHIDKISETLSIDPLEFRFKNYAPCHSTPLDPAFFRQDMKIPYSSKRLDDCMRAVTEAIGWKRRNAPKNAGAGPVARGIGMAAFIANQGGGRPPYAAHADISINRDGAINLFVGVVDIGGGQETIFAMVAAEELGVRVEDITVVAGDTQDTRYAPSCHASRCTAEMVPPVIQAAAEARGKLFQLSAKILEVRLEDLQSQNGFIYSKLQPGRAIPFKEICANISPDEPIRGSGSRDQNPDSPIFATFGAQAAEVEVDTETGRVTILKMAAAQDFGKPINPKFCVSQIYGGIEFGIGYAFSEEGLFDPKTGKMLNNNLLQYRMPTSLDFPPTEVYLVEGEDPYFPYSAKGGAEITNTPTPAAVRNAIFNALGICLNDLPMTPDKMIKALRGRKGD